MNRHLVISEVKSSLLIGSSRLCPVSHSICGPHRWSEPSSSSQSTESCRCAAWRRSTACPTISGIGSWLTRGGARSASASTSPTDTRTTARTECSTPCTAWTTAWAGAANSGERTPHWLRGILLLLLFRLGPVMFCGCRGQLGLLWWPKHTWKSTFPRKQDKLILHRLFFSSSYPDRRIFTRHRFSRVFVL